MVCIIWYLNQFLHIYVCSVHSCVSTCACVHVKASWCWVSSFTDLHLLCWGAGGLPLELREPEGSISLASQLVLGISAPPSDPWNYRWATMAPRLHGCGSVDSRKAAAFPCWAASPPWWCTFLGTMLCFILALPLYVLTPQGSFFFHMLAYTSYLFWIVAILLSMVTCGVVCISLLLAKVVHLFWCLSFYFKRNVAGCGGVQIFFIAFRTIAFCSYGINEACRICLVSCDCSFSRGRNWNECYYS